MTNKESGRRIESARPFSCRSLTLRQLQGHTLH